MYEVFDRFLDTDTWHKRHPSDLERFHRALNKVVWSSEFSADSMGTYMRERRNLPLEYFEQTIAQYVGDAQAIADFIQFTGACPGREL